MKFVTTPTIANLIFNSAKFGEIYYNVPEFDPITSATSWTTNNITITAFSKINPNILASCTFVMKFRPTLSGLVVANITDTETFICEIGQNFVYGIILLLILFRLYF